MKLIILAALAASALIAQNNLTAVGSPSFGSTGCQFGSCVTLSPNNVLTGGAGVAAVFNSNTWTASGWIKASVQGGTKGYLSTNTAVTYANWLGEDGGNITVSVPMGPSVPSDLVFSTGVAPSGSWQHVCISVSGGTNLEVHIDGTRRVNKTGTYTQPGATQIGLGRLVFTGSANDSNVVMDEWLFQTTDTCSGASITVPTSEHANSVANSAGLYHLSNTSDSTGAGAGLTAGTLSSSSITSTGATLSVATISGGTPAYSSQLQRAAFSGSCGSFSNVQSPAAGATPSWNETGLTASTTYCYRVVTTDAASGSVASNTVNVTTSAASLYTRYDGTGPRGGQAVMALVPGSASAIPYTGAPTDVIIYSHGAGEGADAWLTDALKAGFIAPLINAGYILAGTNARGDNWGTQIATDDYADLWQYLKSSSCGGSGCNVRNVVILGQSMGGLTGANLISQGKVPNIRGFACIYCVFNLLNLHTIGTYTSTINTQHGITGTGTATYANMTAGLDPLVVAPTYPGNYRFVRMRFYASPGDTVVPTAQNTDLFMAATARYAIESVKVTATGDHGHSSHFQPSDLAAFVSRCFSGPAFALNGGVQ